MVGLEILDGLSNGLQCSLKWYFKGLFTWRCQPQVGKVTHLGGVACLSTPDHVHMIGGETRRGGLSGLPDQVTLLARVKFGHVKVSRLVNPRGGTWVFFGWVCATWDSKLAPRSKKKFS